MTASFLFRAKLDMQDDKELEEANEKENGGGVL